MKTTGSFSGIFMLVLISFAVTAFAADQNDRLNTLEDTVKKQEQLIEQQRKAFDDLKAEVEKQESQGASHAAEDTSTQKANGLFGGSQFTNPNISLVLDTFYYGSNLTNDELAKRKVPGFATEPLDRRRGFNLDSAELFIFSPVDPYLDLYVNLPVSENGIEIEEAYVVTTSLPAGWQIKGGKFKSNISRLDAQHPHAWDFWDIALPYRAFLGNEGLGGEKGVQVTYLPALPFYTLFGAEILQGENDRLFGASAEEEPHAFSFFVKASVDTSDNSTLYFGPSILFGKTKNTNIVQGAEVKGNSSLYVMEAVWKWKPTNKQALTIQSEYLFLDQSGDVTQTDPATGDVTLEKLKRKQDGYYIQGIYRFYRWGVGARYDALSPSMSAFKIADVQREDVRETPWRATGSVEFNPSEFTRVRFQFTHDRSDPAGRTNDEAILQVNISVGAHPAHSF
jgi:hypothetical protein